MMRYLKFRLFDLIYGRLWQYSAKHGKWRRWTGREWEWRETTSPEWSEK